MEKMIAFCGINCAECPTFLATREDNDHKREKVAEQWSQKYEKHKNLRPEEIICDGCLTENGNLFKTCRVCPVRACGIERHATNCAYCEEYPCQKLEGIFNIAPESKKKLDKIKSKL
jgi:hypothetical protein